MKGSGSRVSRVAPQKIFLLALAILPKIKRPNWAGGRGSYYGMGRGRGLTSRPGRCIDAAIESSILLPVCFDSVCPGSMSSASMGPSVVEGTRPDIRYVRFCRICHAMPGFGEAIARRTHALTRAATMGTTYQAGSRHTPCCQHQQLTRCRPRLSVRRPCRTRYVER